MAPLQDYAGEKSHLTPFLYLGLFTLHYGVNMLPRRARRTLCKIATHFAVYLISYAFLPLSNYWAVANRPDRTRTYISKPSHILFWLVLLGTTSASLGLTPAAGFEPAKSWLTVRRCTTRLHRIIRHFYLQPMPRSILLLFLNGLEQIYFRSIPSICPYSFSSAVWVSSGSQTPLGPKPYPYSIF